MRLVDADELLEYLMINMGWHDEDGIAVDDSDEKRAIIKDLIDGVPTVDAVPVVRCKDCRHYKVSWGQCPGTETGDPFYDWTPAPNWYCADGERS